MRNTSEIVLILFIDHEIGLSQGSKTLTEPIFTTLPKGGH